MNHMMDLIGFISFDHEQAIGKALSARILYGVMRLHST